METRTLTKEEAKQQAETIFRQIPISTKMAVGARNFTRDEDGNITFQVMNKPMRYIYIKLDPTDTYTIVYFRIKRGSYEKVTIKEFSMVYYDMLGEIIYSMTLEY